jgi:hypothetical protein
MPRLLAVIASTAWLIAAAAVVPDAALARGGGPGSTFGTGHLGSPALPDRGNKGGALRGLDRADAVAGDHGDRGRDKAEATQAKKKKK